MNILKQPQLCEDEEQKSLITCTFEEPALLLVSLIGAILSRVPARDNLARPPKTRHTHTHTEESIWVTSSSVQEGCGKKTLNKEGQFVTHALSGDFQLGKEFVKRGYKALLDHLMHL